MYIVWSGWISWRGIQVRQRLCYKCRRGLGRPRGAPRRRRNFHKISRKFSKNYNFQAKLLYILKSLIGNFLLLLQKLSRIYKNFSRKFGYLLSEMNSMHWRGAAPPEALSNFFKSSYLSFRRAMTTSLPLSRYLSYDLVNKYDRWPYVLHSLPIVSKFLAKNQWKPSIF